MISDSAREGFNRLLLQSLKGSLAPSTDDAFELTVLPDLGEVKESKFVILTISSYLFRLMVLIYFSPDETTKEHFARINNVPVAEMNEQAFFDAIAERGNICCGILNRDLGHYFPHMGLSTPNILDKECSSKLDVLGCGHIQHVRVDINSSVHFHASICVCDYADLDFVVEVSEEEDSTGELEMF
ncbi:MAG: hypothetical protein IPH54_18775 [Rhodoferax sp.]|nr:hypothetical protein [Rhodoferax sp.]